MSNLRWTWLALCATVHGYTPDEKDSLTQTPGADSHVHTSFAKVGGVDDRLPQDARKEWKPLPLQGKLQIKPEEYLPKRFHQSGNCTLLYAAVKMDSRIAVEGACYGLKAGGALKLSYGGNTEYMVITETSARIQEHGPFGKYLMFPPGCGFRYAYPAGTTVEAWGPGNYQVTVLKQPVEIAEQEMTVCTSITDTDMELNPVGGATLVVPRSAVGLPYGVYLKSAKKSPEGELVLTIKNQIGMKLPANTPLQVVREISESVYSRPGTKLTPSEICDTEMARGLAATPECEALRKATK